MQIRRRTQTGGSSGAQAQPTVVIVPGSVPLRQYARDIWHHRDLIWILAQRDLTLRYRQTAMGAIWVVLQPLLSAGILSFVFGRVANLPTDGVPNYIFTYVGMLAFGAFGSGLSKASTSLTNNVALVSKIFFPRLVLPLAALGAIIVDFVVGFAVVVVLLFVNDLPPGPGLLLLPLWLGLMLMLAEGVGLLLGSFAARFRDFAYIAPFLLQLMLYASPVAYSVSAVPSQYLTVYYLNPLVALLEAFRWSVLGTPFPTAGHLAYAVACSVVVVAVGIVVFEKRERMLADVI
jgi:lipopolysaccharide transport system permease protein